MKKSLIFAVFAFVFAASGFAMVPNTAEAVCSPNGYFNSGGKCGVSYKNYEDDDDDDDDYSWKKKKNWNQYKYQYKQNFDLDYLQAYINQLLRLLAILEDRDNDDDSSSDIDVKTLAATSIDKDGATLRAKVFLDDEDEGELYFQYGTTARNLKKTTSREDISEDDDGDVIEIDVNDLDEDTRYYFRAVVVDENGDKDYGTILGFFTEDDEDDDTDDEDPVVTTNAERNVDNDSADLRGTVDMNDFENGVAFFVFGEDEDQVDDVEDDFDSYDDVDTDGDDLRKSLVDPDVDDIETYVHNVSDLDSNTDIYFALCVAYEDENDDDTLECGKTRSFETE